MMTDPMLPVATSRTTICRRVVSGKSVIVPFIEKPSLSIRS
jgi:hypothetical protein